LLDENDKPPGYPVPILAFPSRLETCCTAQTEIPPDLQLHFAIEISARLKTMADCDFPLPDRPESPQSNRSTRLESPRARALSSGQVNSVEFVIEMALTRYAKPPTIKGSSRNARNNVWAKQGRCGRLSGGTPFNDHGFHGERG